MQCTKCHLYSALQKLWPAELSNSSKHVWLMETRKKCVLSWVLWQNAVEKRVSLLFLIDNQLTSCIDDVLQSCRIWLEHLHHVVNGTYGPNRFRQTFNFVSMLACSLALSVCLPLLPRTKKKDLREMYNLEGWTISTERSSKRRSFHADGPTIEKALRCMIAKRARGTKNSPLAAERSTRRAAKTDTGQQRTRR